MLRKWFRKLFRLGPARQAGPERRREVCLEELEPRSPGASFMWTGAAGGEHPAWNAAANWSGAGVDGDTAPGTGNDVKLDDNISPS